MKRILIVKFGAIGDVVMTIPAAYEMYRAGYRIDWICGAQVLPLLERYSWIQPIAVNERSLFQGSFVQRMHVLLPLWKRIFGVEYELCVTLYYDRRYRIVSLPVRARRNIMLSHTDRRRRLLPGRHHTDEYLRVMQARDTGPVPVAISPVPPNTLPINPLPVLPGKDRVILVPGGARNSLRSDGLRRWPLENYVSVARMLVERGLDVVLIGGPEDAWASASFSDIKVTDAIGRWTIVETLALMDAGGVVVTHDTGPLHLAGITSAGIVTIFGPTDPRGRLPQRAGAVALWGGEGFACRPCYDASNYATCQDNKCIQQITPEMVVDEVLELMEQRRTGALTPPRVSTPISTIAGGLLKIHD